MFIRKLLGNTKVDHRKNTAHMPPVRMDNVKEVLLPVSQHIGAPATPVVKVGDEVKRGQLIATAEGAVSSPIYASISGKVSAIESYMRSDGRKTPAIRIVSDGLMTEVEGITPPSVTDIDSLIESARASGLVGLGGAGFPTAVKLDALRKGIIDTVIINGAECEPYITSDTRTMLDETEWIYRGIALFETHCASIKKYIFGIEKNKPKCIKAIKDTFARNEKVEVKALPSLYPQGAEKVLIYNATGRVVEAGKLPMTAGCIVINCSTVAFIYDYLKTGVPLIKRRITVDGPIVNKPMNLIVPVGTPVKDILAAANIQKQPDRVLLGGPMMGTCVYDENMPVSKTNNAVILFADTKLSVQTACIRCGRCVRVCSMGLMPTELEHAYDARNAGLLEKLNINLCMNCGACTFVCPAKRNISEKNQLAKLFLRENKS